MEAETSNRQCSRLKHSCGCLSLSIQTRRTPDLAECSASVRPFGREKVLYILDPTANRRCDGLPITCHRPFLSSCTPKAPFDLASSYPPHIFHHTSPTTYYLLRLANHTSPTHHPPRLQPVPSPTLALQPKPSPQTSPIASLSAVSTPATSPSPTHSLAHSLPPSYR